MKTLMELAWEWRQQAALLSMGKLGEPLAARKIECADELEEWVRETVYPNAKWSDDYFSSYRRDGRPECLVCGFSPGRFNRELLGVKDD